MNETTPPSTPGGAQTSQGSGPAAGHGFFQWIRGLGVARASDRWFAGVASGIAHRAGIDPIIVRGLFVVLALLGGPGLLLYIVGWLLLPDAGGRIHVEEVIRGRAGATAVIASVVVGLMLVISFFTGFVAFGPMSSWAPWGWLGFPGWLSTTVTIFIWIGVLIAAIVIASRVFLQHGQKLRAEQQAPPGEQQAPAGEQQVPTSEPQAPAEAQQAPGDRAGDWTAKVSEGAEKFGAKAAAWGENVGKQADDWSVRYAEQHERTKLGAAHIVVTLALALLAAGVAALIAVNLALESKTVLVVAVLAATATLALSIITAGVRGRHSGGIGFLAFCGVVTLIFTSVIPAGSQVQAFGVQHVDGGATSTLLLAGTSEINLNDVLQANPGEDVSVVTVFGNANIVLPTQYRANVDVRLLAGNVTGPGSTGRSSSASGPLISRSFNNQSTRYAWPVSPESNFDEAPTVTVYMLGGNVRVEEGVTR